MFRISLLVLTLVSTLQLSCKSRVRKSPDRSQVLSSPEMLKDPNPIPVPGINDDSMLDLSATNTPCATEISTFGTVAERAWREAFSRAVMQRICGKDPAAAKPWRTASAYNPNSWIAGINLTAITQNVPRGTAITSRHVVYTKHYGFHGQVGQTLNFLTMDNRIISRKVAEVKYLSTTFDPDIAVVRLDSDLPGSITPMKVFHPNATNYAAIFSPLLRIDQESKALIVQATPSGPQGITTDATLNPPGAAYKLYYEDMVSGDSSSPSILLMKSSNGIMPILFGVVTYSGPGQGPRMGANLNQIQSVIESFGDSHKVVTAPEPAAPKAAPTCSLTAARVGNTSNCSLAVLGSADDVSGNPQVTPASSVSWTRSGNLWTGQTTCSINSEITFSATLTGPAGTGRSCESGVIAPVIVLPTCTMSAKRKDQTDSCDLTITQTAGRTADSVSVTPSATINWTKSGSTWSGNTPCAKTVATTFSATLTSSDGKGPSCFSPEVPKVPTPPTCNLTAQRVGYTGNCDVTVTKTSGDMSGNPNLSSDGSAVWSRTGDQFKTTTLCGPNIVTTFSATLSGAAGTGLSCAATVNPVPQGIPFCRMTASRDGITSSCNLTVTRTRGTVTSGPVASPSTPASWTNSSDSWNGKASCPTNTSTRFTAQLTGSDGQGPACASEIIPALTPPSCIISAIRSANSDNCIYTLTRTSGAGTISNFSLLGSQVNWDGNTPASNTIKCSQTSDSMFTATVAGPHGSATCSASVTKLTPPACMLSATRQGTTTTCSLSLTGTGVVDTTKQPSLTPVASGNWSGSNWTGTSNCSTVQSTTFDAMIEGPGGSKASCKSNLVAAVPQVPARTCRAEAVRRGTTGNCILTVTITGQLTGNPRVSPYAPQSWTRSGDKWIGDVVCPVNRNTLYSVNLSGPSGGWGCGSNTVKALP